MEENMILFYVLPMYIRSDMGHWTILIVIHARKGLRCSMDDLFKSIKATWSLFLGLEPLFLTIILYVKEEIKILL